MIKALLYAILLCICWPVGLLFLLLGLIWLVCKGFCAVIALALR